MHLVERLARFEIDRREAVGKGITFKKIHSTDLTKREVNGKEKVLGS